MSLASHDHAPRPAMTDELVLIKWRLGVQTALIAALAAALVLAVFITSRLGFALLGISQRFERLAESQPIRVVPGAAAGVYAPGITEHNVLNAIRYVAGLGTNLTSATARARLDELERYCAPPFLSTFQREKAKRLEEIGTQAQSRSFVRDGAESLAQDDQQIYEYSVVGTWEFRSGGVVMSELRHAFRLRFTIGTPDKGNPYGIQLLAYDVTRLDPAVPRLDPAAAPKLGAPTH